MHTDMNPDSFTSICYIEGERALWKHSFAKSKSFGPTESHFVSIIMQGFQAFSYTTWIYSLTCLRSLQNKWSVPCSKLHTLCLICTEKGRFRSPWKRTEVGTPLSRIHKIRLQHVHCPHTLLFSHRSDGKQADQVSVHYIPSLPAPSGLPYQVAPAQDQRVPNVVKFKCLALKPMHVWLKPSEATKHKKIEGWNGNEWRVAMFCVLYDKDFRTF